VDLRNLAHEERVDARIRPVELAPTRETSRGLADARGDEGLGVPDPRDADGELVESLRRRALEAGHQRLEHAHAMGDRPCHRTDVVEARRERKAAVGRHKPVRRLEAHDSAAGGRNPDRAA
jgi:hypothetical protein